ncbi:PBSX family phage terminase large subunit [Enterococcus sp. BWB1-3]|uniref:PBSX family phage terminase large subunit n=1 Tax=Enterococcus sp. BWB1-3 TaxID=2787713 RepID=UPI001921966D
MSQQKTKPKIIIKMAGALGKGYNRFYHSRNFYRAVKGSRGSKKSKNTALCYIHDILKYPWANLLVVRRFSNTNKQSTYSDLKWACNRLKVAHLFKFNESLPEITVKATGQKILFRGLDDELKITSISVDIGFLCWAWFEEAYQIESKEKFDTVVESIRGGVDAPEDFYKQITLTFNPWSENHWLKKEFFDEGTKRPDTFSTTTTFRVNEWLTDDDRERYERVLEVDPQRGAVVANGEWGMTDGVVYPKWKTFSGTPKGLVEVTGLDWGNDNGAGDPTAIVKLWIDPENMNLYVKQVAYSNTLQLEQIPAKLEKGVKIYADTNIGVANTYLKNRGYKVNPMKTAKHKGKRADGIATVKLFNIYVHENSRDLIGEISGYVQDGTEYIGSHHLLDAMRYGVRGWYNQESRGKV